MLSRVLPTARELFIATVAVLLALTVTNLVRPAEAGAPGPSTDVVFVATGENFPDALGAAAAAGALLAPVLLVQQNSVPQATLDELNRLTPEQIIIVGGSAVISDGVKSTLEGLEFAPIVTRVAGANRYATAAALSEATFPTTGLYPIALHASGIPSYPVLFGEYYVVLALPTYIAPVDGTLIVNSSAYVDEPHTGAIVGCSINDEPSIDLAHRQVWESPGPHGNLAQLAGTRGFDVTAGESIEVRLVCDTTDEVSHVGDSELTAIFVADI